MKQTSQQTAQHHVDPEKSIERIKREMATWPELLNPRSDAVLDVYLDLKSPHAYLAVRPTLEIARDFHVQLNFHPYTLSYEGIGVTTSVEPDMQRRPASAAADRKARMYYATAREYARLQGLPLRSPFRLLDSNLAHQCFLFAKQQDREVMFAMWVYLMGWASGWREFELESLQDLTSALEAVGVQTDTLHHFLEREAQESLDACMGRAEASGVVGVPHYAFVDPISERNVGLFGREHLALIRGKFAAAGLTRHAAVKTEFSHAWQGP